MTATVHLHVQDGEGNLLGYVEVEEAHWSALVVGGPAAAAWPGGMRPVIEVDAVGLLAELEAQRQRNLAELAA